MLTKPKLLLAPLLASCLLLTACAPVTNSPVEENLRTGLPATVAPLPEVKSSSEQIEVLAKLPSQNTQVFVDSVTDSRGTYARYMPVYDFPSGISGEKREVAQFALNFVFLEVVDSIAFDDANRWDEWVANVAPQYISTTTFNEVIDSGSDGIGAKVICSSGQIGSSAPFTIRDGGERVGNKTLKNLSVRQSGDKYTVEVQGSALTYSDDQAMKDWLLVDSGTDLWNDDPAFNDGINHVTTIMFSTELSVVTENGSWKIESFRNNYSMEPSSDDKAFAKNADTFRITQ